MSYVYYNQKFKTHGYDSSGYSFNILNWRVLKNDNFFHGKDVIEGVTLVAYKTIFIPHIVIEDIHSLNRKISNDEKIKQFYTMHGSLAPNVCFKCWGKGKLDWLQKATGVMGPIAEVEFIRDRTSYLTYPGYDNIIFGRPILNEGESYCELCRGTGVELHANLTLFIGMVGIRKKLKSVVTKIEI